MLQIKTIIATAARQYITSAANTYFGRAVIVAVVKRKTLHSLILP